MAPALQWSKMIWHAVAFPSDALVGLTELERMWDRVFFPGSVGCVLGPNPRADLQDPALPRSRKVEACVSH
eukprot:7096360-Pyramimonas_sp.AAC.1